MKLLKLDAKWMEFRAGWSECRWYWKPYIAHYIGSKQVTFGFLGLMGYFRYRNMFPNISL